MPYRAEDRAREIQQDLVSRGQHRAVVVPELPVAAIADVEGLTVPEIRRRLRPDRGNHRTGDRVDRGTRHRISPTRVVDDGVRGGEDLVDDRARDACTSAC